MSRTIKAISEWRYVILTLLVILITDLVITFQFGHYIRSRVQFVFGSDNKDTFSALLFFEGAAFLGVGAWIMSGFSEMRVIMKANPAASAYVAEKLAPEREEYRKSQVSEGMILMLIGVALLALAYVIYLTLR
jgi:hypothetical protein